MQERGGRQAVPGLPPGSFLSSHRNSAPGLSAPKLQVLSRSLNFSVFSAISSDVNDRSHQKTCLLHVCRVCKCGVLHFSSQNT